MYVCTRVYSVKSKMPNQLIYINFTRNDIAHYLLKNLKGIVIVVTYAMSPHFWKTVAECPGIMCLAT